MSLASLRGIWVPLVTPFTGGAVDHDGLARLAASLAADGIAGFVVCGSTGEAATLTDTEQQAVLDTVLRAAGGLPVLMGLSGVATSTMRERLLRLSERPLAGSRNVPLTHWLNAPIAGPHQIW